MELHLVLAGFTNGMLLLFMAMDFAKRRGWVVDSPGRRRLVGGALLVNFMLTVIGWPTGVSHAGLTGIWFAVLLYGLFWPARRRPSQPNQSVTA